MSISELRGWEVPPETVQADETAEKEGSDFSALVRARLYGEAMAASSRLRGMERLDGSTLVVKGRSLSEEYGNLSFLKVEPATPFGKTSLCFDEKEAPSFHSKTSSFEFGESLTQQLIGDTLEVPQRGRNNHFEKRVRMLLQVEDEAKLDTFRKRVQKNESFSTECEVTPFAVAKAAGKGAALGCLGVANFVCEVVSDPVHEAKKVATLARDVGTAGFNLLRVAYGRMGETEYLIDLSVRFGPRLRPLAQLVRSFKNGGVLERVELATQVGVAVLVTHKGILVTKTGITTGAKSLKKLGIQAGAAASELITSSAKTGIATGVQNLKRLGARASAVGAGIVGYSTDIYALASKKLEATFRGMEAGISGSELESSILGQGCVASLKAEQVSAVSSQAQALETVKIVYQNTQENAAIATAVESTESVLTTQEASNAATSLSLAESSDSVFKFPREYNEPLLMARSYNAQAAENVLLQRVSIFHPTYAGTANVHFAKSPNNVLSAHISHCVPFFELGETAASPVTHSFFGRLLNHIEMEAAFRGAEMLEVTHELFPKGMNRASEALWGRKFEGAKEGVRKITAEGETLLETAFPLLEIPQKKLKISRNLPTLPVYFMDWKKTFSKYHTSYPVKAISDLKSRIIVPVDRSFKSVVGIEFVVEGDLLSGKAVTGFIPTEARGEIPLYWSLGVARRFESFAKRLGAKEIDLDLSKISDPTRSKDRILKKVAISLRGVVN